MSVTETDRYRLYESLKNSIGSAEAETLMNLMPRDDWSNLATKADVRDLRAEMQTEFADVRAEMRTEFAEVRTEIAEVRTEIAELNAAIQVQFADFRGELLKTLGTWLFASQAGVIAAIGVIAAVAVLILN